MKIIISEYTPDWQVRFAEEKVAIEDVLKGLSPVVEHIGSTSVNGLVAKPILDIMVGVAEESKLDETINPIKKLGYYYIDKFTADWPERRFFQKNVKNNPNVHSINVHVFVKDSPDWVRHLAFRDYLRATPNKRDEYGKLKRALSEKEFKDRQEYQDAKEDFVKQLEKEALKKLKHDNPS
jgi:GrpB-like predicted nucleotidyltransferase (UPF0157 family)